MLYLWKAKKIQKQLIMCEGKKNRTKGKQFWCVIQQDFPGIKIVLNLHIEKGTIYSQENHHSEQWALRPIWWSYRTSRLKNEAWKAYREKYQKGRIWICLKFKMQELRNCNSMNYSGKQTKQNKTTCLMMNLGYQKIERSHDK